MNKLELKETRYNQYIWNIIISLFFIILIFAVLSKNDMVDTRILARISPFSFILIALASFRLTRLLVADHITEWLRDLCMEKVFIQDKATGNIYMRCEKPKKGVRRAIADLFSCPWCMGIWMALVSLTLYYLAITGASSLAWIILLICAVAGAAEIMYVFTLALIAISTEEALAHNQKGPSFLPPQQPTSEPTSNVCTDCAS